MKLRGKRKDNECPTCHAHYSYIDHKAGYCMACGQHIDWTNESILKWRREQEKERCDNCLYEYACDWSKAGEELRCEDWKPKKDVWKEMSMSRVRDKLIQLKKNMQATMSTMEFTQKKYRR